MCVATGDRLVMGHMVGWPAAWQQNILVTGVADIGTSKVVTTTAARLLASVVRLLRCCAESWLRHSVVVWSPSPGRYMLICDHWHCNEGV
jgi:hypothetical protein